VVAFLDPEHLIARNGTGRAVADDAELCAAIAMLSSDPGAWEAASLRSREYMDNRFNEARMVSPYVEALSYIYERATPVRAS
jgi:hypothetical protein